MLESTKGQNNDILNIMYAQIKIAGCVNSKMLLSSIINSFSRYSSCPEKLVPRSHISHFKYLCHCLRTKNYNDIEFGVTSLNHTKINLETSWKQHVRKHTVTNNRSCFIISRWFHHTSENSAKEKQSVPKVLYMQNPVAWLVNKLDFGMLKRTWDPHFDESEFRRGTKQAVSTITMFVSQNLFTSLKGLLMKHALIALQRDVETNWSDEQRRHIGLEPGDIQHAVPRRVHFQRIVEQKFCDVDMVFIALKWTEHGGSSACIFVEVTTRFHREYTEGHLPDWTVSLFRITRFDILPR